MKKTLLLIVISAFGIPVMAQPAWTLWASGLPGGAYPKLAVAPNHDIFYGLTAGGSAGVIYKANTAGATASFTALPAIPVPASLTNNIMTIVCNVSSEPIAGIFRSNTADPFLFKFDNSTNTWATSGIDYLPNLGAFCSTRAPNGDLWVGCKLGYVYKSTDSGNTFSRIDETAIVKSNYPCYYPTWGAGNPGDGAIYSINVDGNGRVYAGTEGAGVIYSDDAGTTWKPADYYACQAGNDSLKDSSSVMESVSNTGNLGAIGFTANNNLIFNGTQMWTFNWPSSMGLADMTAHTVTPCVGFQQYSISTGLQVTKIVTTANGNIFIHSGKTGSLPDSVGIYTSTDGINWSYLNSGVLNDSVNQAQGSLAVDGNKVFMATTDGKVWMHDASVPTSTNDISGSTPFILTAYPNPVTTMFHVDIPITSPLHYNIVTVEGREIQNGILISAKEIDVSMLSGGFYILNLFDGNRQLGCRKLVKESN